MVQRSRHIPYRRFLLEGECQEESACFLRFPSCQPTYKEKIAFSAFPTDQFVVEIGTVVKHVVKCAFFSLETFSSAR